MARAKKTLVKEKPQFSIHTISLTTDDVAVLKRLSTDASDFLGRSISSSAIVRALVRQIGSQRKEEQQALFLEVEKELNAGVRWGKQK
jgi:hypothetical protein